MPRLLRALRRFVSESTSDCSAAVQAEIASSGSPFTRLMHMDILLLVCAWPEPPSRGNIRRRPRRRSADPARRAGIGNATTAPGPFSFAPESIKFAIVFIEHHLTARGAVGAC